MNFYFQVQVLDYYEIKQCKFPYINFNFLTEFQNVN
ncbi:hypothetical protein AGMMS50249_5680 [candidate division SR1 bacterium]|nr:hypothetical protein AGMMS50249_5680 [candidate division SR1 bacterium]